MLELQALFRGEIFCIALKVVHEVGSRLSATGQPQGAQWWADSSLHYAVPTLYLLWWLIAVPHGALRWSDLLRWLLFPLLYLCWVFLRGAFAHEYPYPFLDLNVHSLAVVLRNCAGVLALFLLLGSVLVLVDRRRGRARQPVAATT